MSALQMSIASKAFENYCQVLKMLKIVLNNFYWNDLLQVHFFDALDGTGHDQHFINSLNVFFFLFH
jgi:hypothetical protein